MDQLIAFQSRFRHSDLSFRSTARPRAMAPPCVLIAVCYAAGLAVHYRWYERTAVPSLSFDEPVDPARWR